MPELSKAVASSTTLPVSRRRTTMRSSTRSKSVTDTVPDAEGTTLPPPSNIVVSANGVPKKKPNSGVVKSPIGSPLDPNVGWSIPVRSKNCSRSVETERRQKACIVLAPVPVASMDQLKSRTSESLPLVPALTPGAVIVISSTHVPVAPLEAPSFEPADALPLTKAVPNVTVTDA